MGASDVRALMSSSLTPFGFFTGENAVTCALVPAVSQARHRARVFPQHRQHLLPGRRQVMDIPRQHARDHTGRPPG
jgi:hypothetical protein